VVGTKCLFFHYRKYGRFNIHWVEVVKAMSLSNITTSGAGSCVGHSIYAHGVNADADSTFTNIDVSGYATATAPPTLAGHLANKGYVDGAITAGGYVVGVGASVDNEITRYDGATGLRVQGGSLATLDDLGNVATTGYFTSTNANTATSNLTNLFRRGDGIINAGWISFSCGSNSTSAGSAGNKVVMGNLAGVCAIGGHNNAHTAWVPFQIGEDMVGGTTTIKGSSISLANTAGVGITSVLESTSPLTGSLRTAGGLGVVKNGWIGGNLYVGTTSASGHIRSVGLAPTISATHTIQSWSTDIAGEITVASSGTAVITFAVAYTLPQGMTVVLTPKTAGAGAYYVSAISGSSFSVVNAVASPITFMYHVIACY